MNLTCPTLLSCCLLILAEAVFCQTYRIQSTITIGGSGGWDYLMADAEKHKLYVSHGTEVVVVDLDSQKVIGRISGMTGIHGIAVSHELSEGYISDGRSNQVVVFDLKSLAIKQKIQAGTNPDAILYDAAPKRIFAFNGRSHDATVIDATSKRSIQTIQLGGKPEFAVSDGKGSIYVNIEDKSEIVRLDANSLKVKSHWPLSPCESPSGMAINRQGRQLFSVCDNALMAVVDADSGKIIATPAIGHGPDAAAYDPGANHAFSSNGEDGTLTVIRPQGKNGFEVQETVQTEKGARTMTIDPTTHRIYLSTADFGPRPEGSHDRPPILPGTFRVLVVGPQ